MIRAQIQPEHVILIISQMNVLIKYKKKKIVKKARRAPRIRLKQQKVPNDALVRDCPMKNA